MNIDDIVNDLIKKPKTKDILKCPKDDLITLHHTTGAYIRNKYKLWNMKWTPELVNGVDYSPNHPDNMSQRIIERLYDYWSYHSK